MTKTRVINNICPHCGQEYRKPYSLCYQDMEKSFTSYWT
ncbi:MAG: hypothetical protein ACLTOT_12395 [Eubacterium callanderi]